MLRVTGHVGSQAVGQLLDEIQELPDEGYADNDSLADSIASIAAAHNVILVN